MIVFTDFEKQREEVIYYWWKQNLLYTVRADYCYFVIVQVSLISTARHGPYTRRIQKLQCQWWRCQWYSSRSAFLVLHHLLRLIYLLLLEQVPVEPDIEMRGNTTLSSLLKINFMILWWHTFIAIFAPKNAVICPFLAAKLKWIKSTKS